MNGSVVHFEVPYDDVARARRFYADVFDWQIQSVPELDYHMVAPGSPEPGDTAAAPAIGGGMLQRNAQVTSPVVVLEVPDIDAAMARVEVHGGTSLGPKMPVGSMGFAAYFRDTEGNTLGLWQSAE